jgi:hypothetical protein
MVRRNANRIEAMLRRSFVLGEFDPSDDEPEQTGDPVRLLD